MKKPVFSEWLQKIDDIMYEIYLKTCTTAGLGTKVKEEHGKEKQTGKSA